MTPSSNQSSSKFDNPISEEYAYQLICTMNADMGGRDSISARGWLKYSSWYSDRMTLTDGSFIYREPYVDAHLIHSNITPADTINWLLENFTPIPLSKQ